MAFLGPNKGRYGQIRAIKGKYAQLDNKYILGPNKGG